MSRGLSSIKSMTINTIDLSKVNDGLHEGSFAKGRWNYEVAVAVNGNKITNIAIVNDKMKMFSPMNDSLIHQVIHNQMQRYDGIARATVTSKAFYKAVENALTAK
jgi:uncharacterized protein with FMN-binding domain